MTDPGLPAGVFAFRIRSTLATGLGADLSISLRALDKCS